MPAGAALSADDMRAVLDLREAVSAVLEPMRANGVIGAALQAEVDAYLPEALLQRVQPVASELRFLFITSRLDLHPLSARPDDAVKGESSECWIRAAASRTEEHTSELQSLMRLSYAVFCLKKKK